MTKDKMAVRIRVFTASKNAPCNLRFLKTPTRQDTMNDDETLVAYLHGQGCNEEDVRRVLEKLQRHDQETFRDSVFDSIERGSFDLQSIIEESKDENK